MSRDQNRATQEHLGELINAGAFDRLGEVFAPDVVDHDPAPDQGAGVEGFQSFFTTLGSAFPDAKVEVDAAVADDDHVAIAYRLSGTHRGEFHGVPATGKTIDVRALQIARFENGLIVERWGASDQLSILQQLGVEVPS